MDTLTFNNITEKNLVSFSIFKELVSLRVKIDFKIAHDQVFDGEVEEYNILFNVYKNINDLDSEKLSNFSEQTIKDAAKNRVEKKIFV